MPPTRLWTEETPMPGKTTLVAFDPSGGRHTVRTAAGYTWAAFIRHRYGDSRWSILVKGWSPRSVHDRARSAAGDAYFEMARLTPLADTVPAAVARYFAAHRTGPVTDPPTVHAIFVQGQGWIGAAPGQRVTSAWLRTLADGVTSVAVTAGGHVADFARDELHRP